ncbi:hypothetical protein ABJI51_03855 [Amycolatopsis sp. NEAU-NG30]|uniref:Uncharacterized protein n=1 Tax=Amycolatopsis melonis TaxID=3156488 RepID=A0ABV0L7A3_9PSEU
MIRVDVAGVNLSATWCVRVWGRCLGGGRPFPRVLGMEAAGTVRRWGRTSTASRWVTRSSASRSPAAAYVETMVLSAPSTARIPADLYAPVAATLPIAGTTAVDVLDQLGLPAGATVLVNGVGGGVGLAVARLAAGREQQSSST